MKTNTKFRKDKQVIEKKNDMKHVVLHNISSPTHGMERKHVCVMFVSNGEDRNMLWRIREPAVFHRLRNSTAFQLTPFKPLCMTSNTERPSLTVYPSSVSSLAAYYFLNFLRPAQISGLEAQLVKQQWSVQESHRSPRFFLFGRVGLCPF